MFQKQDNLLASYAILEPCSNCAKGIKEKIRKKLTERGIKFHSYLANLNDLKVEATDKLLTGVIFNPYIDGYDILCQPQLLRNLYPQLKFIAITTSYSQLCVNAVNNGFIDAYLLNDAEPKIFEEVIDAIQANQLPYFHNSILKTNNLHNKIKLNLNNEEIRTFYHLLQLKTKPQIAELLCKTEGTIANYVTKINRVTNTYNIRELIKFAIDNYFISFYELGWWAKDLRQTKL